MNKFWILLLVVLVGISYLIIDLLSCVAPADDSTRGGMMSTQSCIRKLYLETGALPESLESLRPYLPNNGEGIIDAWGRVIDYRIVNDKVILSSLGQDGKSGGVGLDTDIVFVFCPFGPEDVFDFGEFTSSTEGQNFQHLLSHSQDDCGRE